MPRQKDLIRSVEEDGTVRWELPDGKLHREDGPAFEWPDGTRSWYVNGIRHREDGPAIEYSNGTRSWYLNGYRLVLTDELKISHPILYNQMLVYEVMKK